MLARAVEALGWGLLAALVAVPGLPAPDGAAHTAPAVTLDGSAGRTLAAPPAYQPGEWWDLEVAVRGGSGTRGTAVFEGTAPDGSPRFGVGVGSVDPLLFDTPLFPVGQVPAATLSYDLLGHAFQPLRFPLAPGASWATSIGGEPVTATVVQAGNGSAHVRFASDGYGTLLDATYDAALGWYRSMDLVGRRTLTVAAHGFGYSCPSVFPDHLSRTFNEHVLGLASEPVRAHRLSVGADGGAPDTALVTIAVGLFGSSPGYARQEIALPDGSVLQAESSAGRKTVLATIAHPVGDWVLTSQVAGDSYAAVMLSWFTAMPVPAYGSSADGTCEGPATAVTPAAALAGPPGPPAAAALPALGWAWRLTLLAAALAARQWRRLGWATAALYARVRRGGDDSPARRRILDELAARNGQSTQELRLRLDLGWGTAVHHLSVLARDGRVLRARAGRRTAWLLPRTAPAEAAHLLALLVPRARDLYETVKSSPGATQSELADRLHLHPATVHHHVRKLAAAGLLSTRREGRRTRHYVARPAT